MRSRIGAGLLIAVAALLMSGELGGFFARERTPNVLSAQTPTVSPPIVPEQR